MVQFWYQWHPDPERSHDLISSFIHCSETSSVSNSSDGGLYTNDEGRQGTSLKSVVWLVCMFSYLVWLQRRNIRWTLRALRAGSLHFRWWWAKWLVLRGWAWFWVSSWGCMRDSRSGSLVGEGDGFRGPWPCGPCLQQHSYWILSTHEPWSSER